MRIDSSGGPHKSTPKDKKCPPDCSHTIDLHTLIKCTFSSPEYYVPDDRYSYTCR